MSRLAPFDKALVLILVPFWAVCFALSIKPQIRDTGMLGLGVSAPASLQGYPAVTEPHPLVQADFTGSGLRRGDAGLSSAPTSDSERPRSGLPRNLDCPSGGRYRPPIGMGRLEEHPGTHGAAREHPDPAAVSL